MELLIYAPSAAATPQQLLNKVTSAIGTAPVNLFDSVESFTQYLRQPISETLVALLFPKDNAELSILINIRHLMRDMQIVLVLPNQDKQTISDGHFLRPRYVSHADGDLSDVVAVVRKMMGTEPASMMQAV